MIDFNSKNNVLIISPMMVYKQFGPTFLYVFRFYRVEQNVGPCSKIGLAVFSEFASKDEK